MKIFYKFILLFYFCTFNAYALSPEDHLGDTVSENRAQNLFTQVRCLVCKAQAVEGSDTEFSYQMRKLIRQKISEGKSDEQIKDELVKEFGNNVLMSGKFLNKSYFLLWILPFIFASILIFSTYRIYKLSQAK